MKERTNDLLCTEIFGLCFNQARTIDDITTKIYKSCHAKNVVRIFQCCESLMKTGIMIPKFVNGRLLFQVNQEALNIKEKK